MRCNFRYAQCILGCMMICLPLLAAAKERIVTLSPAINEIVFALGAGEKVVGTTTYADYPPAAQKLPKVGGYFSPSLEKILALDPTLVILQPNNQKLKATFQTLKIPTLTVPIDTLSHILSSIEAMGKRLGKEKEAIRIISRIRNELDAIQGIVRNKRILIVFGANTTLEHGIFVAGQNLYYDEIIRASGNQNALQSKRKGQPVLGKESLIALDPDIIILLTATAKAKGIGKEALLAPWRTLPLRAVHIGDIYLIDKEYALIPSDRLRYFIRNFKEVLDGYRRKHAQ